MRGSRFMSAIAATVLVLALPAVAGADEPLLTDPCGAFGSTDGGEFATVPQLDVCEADVTASYSDRSLVLDLTAELAGDLGELEGASYRLGWTNDEGCAQYVEIRDPSTTSPVALFAYACGGTDQSLSIGGVSPDSCATADPYANDTVHCYGEAMQWVLLPTSAVTIDGATLAVTLPVHLLLQDADTAGFAPGQALDTLTVRTYYRADRVNVEGRGASITLTGTTYETSLTDQAAGGSLTIPQPPEEWDPDVPAGAGPVHTLEDGLSIETDESGRIELLVEQDVTISSTGITVESDGEWAGVVIADLDDDSAFSARRIQYPEYRSGGASITLDAADAGPPPFPYGLIRGAGGSRLCSSGCRIPAGSYSVIAITDGGAPVTIAIEIDDADGPLTPIEELRPVVTHAIEPPPIEHVWHPDGSSGGGGQWTAWIAGKDAAIALTQLRSVVESGLVGRLRITGCATVDNECSGGTHGHLYAANAVQGREGLTSFDTKDMPAGQHGLSLSYSYDQFGGGEFEVSLRSLWVYPR